MLHEFSGTSLHRAFSFTREPRPRSHASLQSRCFNVRRGPGICLSQADTPTNPLRPSDNTKYGNSAHIRKLGWFAGERLQGRQCLFHVGEHCPIEKGWEDRGQVFATRINLGDGCGICNCVEIWHRSGFWCACSPNSGGHRWQECEN
jgi:hypothetical protein